MDGNTAVVIITPILVIGLAAILVGRRKGKVGPYVFSTVFGALFVALFMAIVAVFFHIANETLKQLYMIILTPFVFGIVYFIGGKIYGKVF